MRSSKVYALLLVAGALLMAPSAFAGKGGFPYSSEEGKMSIVFPATYETSFEDIDGGETYKINTEYNEHVLLASYTIHFGEITDLEELAQVSLDAFNQHTGGRIVQQMPWKVKGGHKGLKALISIDDQAYTIQYQVVLVGNLQYQIVALGPDYAYDKKMVAKFMKSFKIKK